MKKIFVKPEVKIKHLHRICVIATSDGEEATMGISTLHSDDDYRQSNSRSPWGNGIWD